MTVVYLTGIEYLETKIFAAFLHEAEAVAWVDDWNRRNLDQREQAVLVGSVPIYPAVTALS